MTAQNHPLLLLLACALTAPACAPTGSPEIAFSADSSGIVEGAFPDRAAAAAGLDLEAEAAAAAFDLASLAPTPAPVLTAQEGSGGLLASEATPHHDPRFHDHYEEALLHLDSGERGAAIDALRLAVFDAPDSALTWFTLGETYAAAGRARRGVECVEEAVRLDDRLLPARRFLARHFLDRGEPGRARPHAQKLAGLAREDAGAAHLLARTYTALSMWKEAIAQNRRAISLDPQNVYAYNNLGFAAIQLGRVGLAVQYLEAAQELEPVEPYMLNNLGVAYERSDRNGDALAAFARAADLDPTYVKALANRDRVRVIVDREVADEVSRILAEQARKRTGVDVSTRADASTPSGD